MIFSMWFSLDGSITMVDGVKWKEECGHGARFIRSFEAESPEAACAYLDKCLDKDELSDLAQIKEE